MSTNVFSRDRLQPALLDRLIDEAPGSDVEAPEQRAITRSRLRTIVLRDLAWLFNATSPLIEEDARRFPLAARSVINFGLPTATGTLVSKLDLTAMEQMLRQAIIDFEPRILPLELDVRGRLPDDPMGHHNVIEFTIIGRLWAQPYPLELMLRTHVDMETGMADVSDARMGTDVLRGAGAGS